MIKKEFLMLKFSFSKSDFSKLSFVVADDEITLTMKNIEVILDYHL